MGMGIPQCQDPQPSLGAAHGTDPPSPLQLLGLPLAPALGAVLQLELGLLLLQGLQVGQQGLKDGAIVPPPAQQAEGERLSLQSLQHGPSLERGREEQRGAGGTRRGHPSPLSPPTCPGEAYLSEQPLISSRMSPASTTSSTSAWLSGSTLVTKTRPSTYLGVQPSLSSATGTLPGSPLVPSMTFHPHTECREKPPHGQEILARLS